MIRRLEQTVPTANSDLFEMIDVSRLPRKRHFDVHSVNCTSHFSVCLPFPSFGGTENFALRHQLNVLKRSVKQRPKLTPADRLLWVVLSRVWGDWRSALAIVQPETVIAWHRKGFRLFWAWKVRRGHPGRPAVSLEVRGPDPADGSRTRKILHDLSEQYPTGWRIRHVGGMSLFLRIQKVDEGT
jgi:hypothetical protein